MLIIGWVLHIGRAIFIPIVLGAAIVYVIVGLTHAQQRIPILGQALPIQLRYLLAVLFIGLIVGALVYLVLANKERVLALTPKYQEWWDNSPIEAVRREPAAAPQGVN